MPVEMLDTPDPSRSTVTSISVSLVLRLIVAVRMKTASLDRPLACLTRKRGPFNRPMAHSLLRDDALKAELRAMLTGIRAFAAGIDVRRKLLPIVPIVTPR